jgi:hypothetical protein
MRVGALERASAATKSKEVAEPLRRHRSAAAASLKDEKEPCLLGALWSLEPKVVAEKAREERGHGQSPLSLSFASNPEAPIGPHEISNVNLDDFSRAEAAEKHEVNDGQVSIAFETTKEGPDLIRSQGLDEEPWLFDPRFATTTMKSVNSERVVESWAPVVNGWTEHAWTLIELAARAEAKEKASRREAPIDRAGRRLVALLSRDEVDEVWAVQLDQRSVRFGQPTMENEEIERV